MSDAPTVVIVVPVPPSANRMFTRRMTRKGRRDLTIEYKEWRDRAGWLARMQLVGVPEIMCRFDVSIEVPISRKDTDNHIKPLLDLCQLIHAISDDGNQHSVKIVPTNRADCMIALTPLPNMSGIRASAKSPWRTSGRKSAIKGTPMTAGTLSRARRAGILV